MTTTLLGVDDSKTMRKVLEITFAGEDFRTILAENADDAMSKLGAERPSIVLVDAGLDGTNGYELCQRIKAAAPSVAVLLLASKQQPYDRNRGGQVGADDFVDKPFDTQQLIDKVGALVRKLAGAPATATAAPAPVATGPQPIGSTQQGLGPTPAVVMTSRPASLDISQRPRAQTLAYGQNPMGGAGPVAPMIPSPAAGARSSPVSAPSPFAARPAPTPPAPAVAPAPAPFASAPPVPAHAPQPVAVAAAAPVASAANGADLSHKLAALGLTQEQVTAVLALSREIVEKVVWEVVPTLAEAMIQEEIKRLTADS